MSVSFTSREGVAFEPHAGHRLVAAAVRSTFFLAERPARRVLDTSRGIRSDSACASGSG